MVMSSVVLAVATKPSHCESLSAVSPEIHERSDLHDCAWYMDDFVFLVEHSTVVDEITHFEHFSNGGVAHGESDGKLCSLTHCIYNVPGRGKDGNEGGIERPRRCGFHRASIPDDGILEQSKYDVRKASAVTPLPQGDQIILIFPAPQNPQGQGGAWK